MPVTESKTFRINVSKDRLTATLSVNTASPPGAYTPKQIAEEVSALDITIDEQGNLNLEEFCKKLAENTMPEPVVIAQGTPPVHAKNGQIQKLFALPDAPESPEAENEQNQTQSFYDRSDIVNVEKGQELVKLIPPQAGEDGLDVYGKAIPHKLGREVQLKLGPNVEQKADIVYATTSGKLEFSLEKISVNEILEIAGNVDFSVGNIHFPGDVVIRKNVLDLFKVHSESTIAVHGVVEAAEIQAGKDVVCTGGVAGKEKGVIIAGGEIQCKYITNAKVRAGKNIIVHTEIVNCDLICKGSVTIENGKLVGGNTIATGGLKAKILGSDAGVKTRIEVGADDELRQTFERVAPEIKVLRHKATKVRQVVEPLLRNQKVLNAEQKEKATELLYTSYELDEKAENLIQELRKADEIAKERAVALVEVLGDVYSGVMLFFPRLEAMITQPLKGPVKFEPRKIDGTLQIAAVDCNTGSTYAIHSGHTSDEFWNKLDELLSS